MTYDGEYGRDETCPCGHYWRSCSLHASTGPNPQPGDVERALEERKRGLQEARDREAELRNSYNALDNTERAIAEALWDLFLENYPGVEASLPDAVRGESDSWVVGRSRTVCKEATVAATAARRTLAPN